MDKCVKPTTPHAWELFMQTSSHNIYKCYGCGGKRWVAVPLSAEERLFIQRGQAR